jgi:ferrous iron transport protein A
MRYSQEHASISRSLLRGTRGIPLHLMRAVTPDCIQLSARQVAASRARKARKRRECYTIENDFYLRTRQAFLACCAAVIPPLDWKNMRLSELSRRTVAIVKSVDDATPNDPVARRLRDLGFVPGETVQIITFGPFGKDPLVAQVGFTRFALRRSEADRIAVEIASATISSIAPASQADTPDAAKRIA